MVLQLYNYITMLILMCIIYLYYNTNRFVLLVYYNDIYIYLPFMPGNYL